MFVTRRLAKSSILRARSISTLARSCVLIALLAPVILRAQINVLMNRYDPQRTGANLSETTLSAANVDSGHFGRLRTYAVDGAVLAQPLYVRNVTIGGSPRNVLYVATMNDKVYAFDTNSATTTPLWMADFTHAPAVTPIPITDITSAGLNVVGNVGIQSTPVIDQSAGTIYVVARTEGKRHICPASPRAVDCDRPGAPGEPGEDCGVCPRHGARFHIERERSDHHVRSEDAITARGPGSGQWRRADRLGRTRGSPPITAGSWRSTRCRWRESVSCLSRPTRTAEGSGRGGAHPPLTRAGTRTSQPANGKWDGSRNFGDSLLKLHADRTGIDLLDYFTPGNEADLNPQDYDLSGSGFTLLPGTNLLLGGGKEGVLYLLNAGNLGHKVANDKQIVQRIPTGGTSWEVRCSGTRGPPVRSSTTGRKTTC